MTRMPTGYLLSVGRNSLSDGTQKSRPEQEAINREAAARYGYEIPQDAFYFDQMSRSEWPRPGLSDALDRVEEDPDCRGIVVWNSDRCIGDENQLLAVFDALEEGEAYLIEGDPYRVINPTDAGDRLIGLFKASGTSQEVTRLRERTYSTHRQKVLRGKYISKPVWGTRSIEHLPITDKERDNPTLLAALAFENERRASDRRVLGGMLEPDDLRGWIIRDEVTLSWVRRMWYWVADEGVSFWEVCNRLQAAGVPNASGKDNWHVPTVRRLFTNPMYRGEMRWNQTKTKRPRNRKTGVQKKKITKRDKSEHILERSPFGVLLASPHAGIQDPDHDRENCEQCLGGIQLWHRARIVIDGRTTQHDVRRKHPPSVLEPFVRCGRCGKRMYRRKMGAKKRKDGTRPVKFLYRCATKRNTKTGCDDFHEISETKIYAALEAAIFARAEDLPPTVTVKLDKRHAPDTVDERTVLNGRLEALDGERKRSLRLLTQGRIDEADWTSLEAEWSRERSEIEARLVALTPPAESPERVAEIVATRSEALGTAWHTIRDEDIPVGERQVVFGRLVEVIEVDAPSVSVFFGSD